MSTRDLAYAAQALHADKLAGPSHFRVLEIGVLAGRAGRIVVAPEEAPLAADDRSFAADGALTHGFYEITNVLLTYEP